MWSVQIQTRNGFTILKPKLQRREPSSSLVPAHVDRTSSYRRIHLFDTEDDDALRKWAQHTSSTVAFHYDTGLSSVLVQYLLVLVDAALLLSNVFVQDAHTY